ncbi:MAG: four helix bundle protein [Bacteroidales bacterium]|jgi:four helix bundle protein|nr:four helix bundle protein [Bacteroidales bacterium]
MRDNVVFTKSKDFALDIISLYKFLTENKKEYTLSKQLLRSGTSIGANIAESEYAISDNDFLAKLYISLKECAETRYWLELLVDSNYIDQEYYLKLYSKCN